MMSRRVRILYAYYCLMRPPAPGAVPTRGLVEMESFDRRYYVEIVDRMAWGWVGYDRPLSPSEVDEYELISVPRDLFSP